MPDTIAAAEAEGFTHIEARCTCGQITAIPFRMLKEINRAKPETLLADVASRLRCKKCKAPPEKWRPWRQYLDGSMGYAWGTGHKE